MTIKEFAEARKLRLCNDGCGDPIVPGRPPYIRPEDSCHLFDNEDGRLGVCLYFQDGRGWTAIKKRFAKLRLELKQDGEWEGTHLFDPENMEQVKAVLRAVKPKRKPGTIRPDRVTANSGVGAPGPNPLRSL